MALKTNKKYNICSSSLHSHRLRHTFITRCIENKMNPKVLQTLVGHTKGSSITSDIYTSISNEFIEKEFKKNKLKILLHTYCIILQTKKHVKY